MGELITKAQAGALSAESHVGEDSAFCDALGAAGGKIYVDADLVIGHVAKDIIGPQHLRRVVEERETLLRLACGVLE